MTQHRSRFRRSLFALAKVALALCLLGYLLHQAREHDTFSQLVEQPKRWPLLVAGLGCTLVAITMSFFRWHLFIRAVGISIRLMDTVRLGALGFALNFVSLGSIGGDLFKTVFLAHGQPGRRTEAVASVLADRVMGLLTILVLASGGILFTDLRQHAPPTLVALCNAILACTLVIVTGAFMALLVPGLSGPRMVAWSQRLPIVGTTIARLIAAVATYRNQKWTLAAAAAVSLVGNVANIATFYLIASGLPIERPTFLENFVIVPIANMVGAIPATPSGLGTKEAAVELLYRTVPENKQIVEGAGTMVALTYRIMEFTMAFVGLVYYFSHRKEVSEVVAEAEESEEAGELS